MALVPSEKVIGERAPILDVDRLRLDEGALVRLQTGSDIADVAGHARGANGFAPRARLDLLEVKHRRERMAAHADQRAAAGHRPLCGMRRMRARVAFLALHEQDLVLCRAQHLRGLGDRRRVDPVLRIHEELAGRFDRGAGRLHLRADALIHQRFRDVLADRRLIAVAAEIAGERLFADHMLAGAHRRHDHRRVQIGRRADVDDVDRGVGDQLIEAAVARRDFVLAREIR